MKIEVRSDHVLISGYVNAVGRDSRPLPSPTGKFVEMVEPGVFRAAGDAKVCMVISIISMWIFRIIFSYVLGKYMGMEVFGVWVAMVIDWVVRCICFIIRYFGGKWKKAAIV